MKYKKRETKKSGDCEIDRPTRNAEEADRKPRPRTRPGSDMTKTKLPAHRSSTAR